MLKRKAQAVSWEEFNALSRRRFIMKWLIEIAQKRSLFIIWENNNCIIASNKSHEFVIISYTRNSAINSGMQEEMSVWLINRLSSTMADKKRSNVYNNFHRIEYRFECERKSKYPDELLNPRLYDITQI